MNSIKIQILDPRLKQLPIRYATSGSAGLDLRACIHAPSMVLPAGEVRMISAGFSVELLPGTAAMLLPRSGLGHRHGIVLGNLVGLIDSDYRGEVMISAWNRSPDAFLINAMERLAQMVIVPVITPEVEVVERLSASDERGRGGFGSTGLA